MSKGNNVQIISQVILLVLLLISPFLSSFSQAKEVHKTILWQQEAEEGVVNLFMLSDQHNTTNLIVHTENAIYILNPHSGYIKLRAVPSSWINNKLVVENVFSDSTLADIDSDSTKELLIAGTAYFGYAEYSGELLIYDPFTGILEGSFYYGNRTTNVHVGTFKPCNNKGIILLGEITYYLNQYDFFSSQYLAILDSETFELVFLDTNLANSTLLNTGAIFEPFLYDLTGDGFDEIILSIGNATTDSTVVVLDGTDFHVLWRQYLPTHDSLGLFQASDIDYYDFTGDGTVDLLFTDGASGLVLLDGRNGTLLWFTQEYGHVDSTLADIDEDGKIEVITTCLEDLAILDGQTGTVEISTTLSFTFDGSGIVVVDIANNGSEYILCNSMYGNLYLFSPTFDLVDILDTPGGWVTSFLLYDLTGEGTLEIIGGSLVSNLIFAYIYVGEITPSLQSFTVSVVIGTSVLVLGAGISFYLFRRYRSHS